jgi:hypothetical protein
MPIKPFNSVAGFSVGTSEAITIINANGNVSTSNLAVTGPASLGNVGNVKVTGGTAGQFLQTDGSGNLVFATIGTASLSNGTSNVNVLDSGNITFSVAGNANVATITGTGMNVTGTLNATGTANVGNLGVAGNANVGANLGVAGNISTLGILTDNIYYANGTRWDLQEAAGSNTQIQYNMGNNFAASANFTFNDATNVLTVTGNVNASNANLGNVATANFLGGTLTTAAQPNITSVGSLSNLTIAANGNINMSGAGATLTGANLVSASFLTGTLTTAAQPNITSVGNLTSLDVTGNVTAGNANLGNLATANFFSGNGSLLTAINGANVTGQVGNALVAGTVYTAAQPNITSVGNLTSLVVTGNASAGNLSTAGNIDAAAGNISGNLTVGNTITLGNGTGGNIAGANVITANLFVGTLANAAQPNITSIGTLSNLTIAANGNINMSGANSTLTGANLVSASFLTGTLTTAAQPNITSVGNLTSLTVTGNSSLGSNANLRLTGGSTGQVLQTDGAGNLSWVTTATSDSIFNGTSNVSIPVANGNINLVSGGNTTMVVTGTGVNVAGTLNATSNANLGANLGVVGSVTAGNLVTNAITGASTGVTITAAGTNQNVNLVPTGTGTVNVGNFIISNVATPVAASDAATKQYVDDVAQGLHVHASCNAATTGSLASITGGSVTYNNGTDGVGATLTLGVALTNLDGVALSDGMRILVKNEGVNNVSPNNGIYVRTSSTVLTRAADFNSAAEIAGGDFTFVTSGTQYNSTGWVQIDEVTTVGTDPIVWEQFSGAGTYTAGTGLTLTGSVFSITNTTVTPASYGGGDSVATFTVNAQGQLTAASNVAITANAANLSGTTLNSGVVTSSLTSVGTLGNLAVTGDATFGNAYANSGTIGAANLTGTLTTNAQPNVTSVGTLTGLTVGNATANTVFGNGTVNATGNISAANFIGNVVGNISGNVAAPGSNTEVVFNNAGILGASNAFTFNNSSNVLTVAGNLSASNANLGNLATANFVAGTLTTAAQPNITSVGSLTGLNVGGNVAVTGGNITTNGQFTGATLIQSGANANIQVGTGADAGNLVIKNSAITSTTTSGLSANVAATIASVQINASAIEFSAVEFLVKARAFDGSLSHISTVLAIYQPSTQTVDFNVFGSLTLGTYPGSLDVIQSSGNILLRATQAVGTNMAWAVQTRML